MDGIEMAHRPTGDPLLPRHLKFAVRYLRDNLERKITLAELAHNSGTAERTLQRQFREVLGMPPLGYLRRLRLLAAREELSQPDSDSIADVATRLGCPHLGRFAADYRRCFGEPPSATYERTRARRHESSPPRAAPAVDRPRYDRPSLVVMPLRTETSGERVMAEGLVEHIAATLSRTHAATVRLGRAGHPGTRSHDRRAAGARYCLMGRVAHSGERARVTVRLVDAGADRHVWGDSFDGLVREPFALQDRVADGVLHGVVPALTQAEVERLNDRPCDTLGAREMVLRAMPLAFAADIASAHRLLTVTGDALDKDPGDALSIAMAALAHAQIANLFGTTTPAAERQTALRLTEQAGVLDDGDSLVVAAAQWPATALALFQSNDEGGSIGDTGTCRWRSHARLGLAEPGASAAPSRRRSRSGRRGFRAGTRAQRARHAAHE